MKRRAVRLVVAWLLEQNVEDWVLDTACRVLICADIEDWQAFLVLVDHPDRVCVSWCLTPGMECMVTGSAVKRGLPWFTVPVADILDAELRDQLVEFVVDPDNFEFEHPAPVDIVDCGTR